MARYECSVCGYVYDERRQGQAWDALPEGWTCPVCGSSKPYFSPMVESGDDLRRKIDWLREKSAGRPIGVKIAAGHIEADLATILPAGPDCNRSQAGDWLILRPISGRKMCLSPSDPRGTVPFSRPSPRKSGQSP